MQKLLFLILLCSSFVSCSSDDDENPQTGNPISNLGMPQSSNDSPIKSGESVTIKGEGFTQLSEIWFRSVTKSVESSDTKAEIMSITVSGISFIAPAISGERNIILKQSGQEYTLGEMYFENSSETIVKKRILKTDYWGYTTEFIYNEDGKVSCIKEYELSLTKGGGYNNESILTYNSEGLLIQVTEREAISKEKLGEISFEYSDKYTVKVTDKQAKGGWNAYYTTLTLNELGQLKDLKTENLQIKYEYDEIGNVSKLTKIEFYSGMYHTTTHTYKYDDKKSYLSNTGLPIWYWIYDYSNITKNSQYCYDGPNNVTEHKSDDGGLYLFKYDYDDYDYPTAIYDADDNEKMSDFIYETIN